MNDVLKEQQFQDIEIKEVILRDWVVDEKDCKTFKQTNFTYLVF